MFRFAGRGTFFSLHFEIFRVFYKSAGVYTCMAEREYSRISVWVHPLWALDNDLGQALVDDWRKQIEQAASDLSSVLVLVQPAFRRPAFQGAETVWMERVRPLIEELPGLFGERYLRWDPRYQFVDGTRPTHIAMLCGHFGITPQGSNGSRTVLFQRSDAGGLYTELCVRRQLSLLAPISDAYPSYWGRN